jgi:hypothetical protein
MALRAPIAMQSGEIRLVGPVPHTNELIRAHNCRHFYYHHSESVLTKSTY